MDEEPVQERSLTHGQLAMVAAKRVTMVRGSIAAQRARLGAQAKTAADASAELGISRSSVVLARWLLHAGHPEVVRAVEAGRLNLEAAESIVRQVLLSDQPVVVERVIAANQGKKTQVVARVLHGPKPYHPSPKRRLERRMENVLSNLAVSADHFDELVDEALGHPSWPVWVKRARAMRGRLSAAIRRAGKG